MSHEDNPTTPELPARDPVSPGTVQAEEAPANTAPVPQVMEEDITGVVAESIPGTGTDIPMEVGTPPPAGAPPAGAPPAGAPPAGPGTGPAGQGDGELAEEPDPDDAVEEPTATGTVFDALSRRVVELEHALAEEKSHRLRALADLDNWRKRSARDQAVAVGKAQADVVIEFLPVLDHLELALEHVREDAPVDGMREGVAMVLRQFRTSLAKFGIQELDAAGRPFDPAFHEAMAQSPSEELPAGFVVKQWQKGFMLGDRLIRPCRVVVSSGPGPASENTPVDPTED